VLAVAGLVAGSLFAGDRIVRAVTKPSPATLAARSARAAASREALVPKVRYAVGGTAKRASAVVVTPDGPQELDHIAVPLATKSGTPYLQFDVKSGDPVGISVRSEDGGIVTCTISVGSKVVATSTASSGLAPAVCEGAVP
jgi:hypothetical protein